MSNPTSSGIALNWQPERVYDFWRFVSARHDMFINRVVLQYPAPWSSDPLLTGAYYTNVYRELDRVTLDLVRSVLIPSKGAPIGDRLFNIILYRVFNLPVTFKALGGYKPMRTWDFTRARRILKSRRQHGMKVFTGAFTVNASSPLKKYQKPGGKIDLWVDRLIAYRKGMPALVRLITESYKEEPILGMRQAHAALMTLDGIGRFLAYEILIDACYHPKTVRYSENDWVNAGPGAKLGLKEMLGAPYPRREHEWTEAIRALYEWQIEARRKAGVKLHGPNLTLRNVEHSLCEYSKYARLRRGIHPKRTFNPATANRDLTPWKKLNRIYYLPQ